MLTGRLHDDLTIEREGERKKRVGRERGRREREGSREREREERDGWGRGDKKKERGSI